MGQEKCITSQRKWKQLTEKERYKIEALWNKGIRSEEIGRELNRDRRTIERELSRGMVRQRNSNLTEKWYI
jgi:IS30 family transposase